MKKYLFWMSLGLLIGGAYGWFGACCGLLGGAIFAFANPLVWRGEYETLLQRIEKQPSVPPEPMAVIKPDSELQPKVVAPDLVPPLPNPVPSASVSQPAPAAPGLFDKIGPSFVKFFTQGNVVAKIGMLLLFFGVAFLLKLAADYGKFPVYLRLLCVGLGSFVLLGAGWRLRTLRPLYAVILQGGGIGIFYADVFAAYRYYHLIPAGFAFATMFIAIFLATLLAIQQRAKSLAVMATLCGYLVPILISTGSKNHVALFSYYLLLNLGIFAVAWFQTWRILHILGFFFTFGVGAIWGTQYYQPEFFASVEPFLILNFLCYFVISILYALKKAAQRQALVDGTLVFGTPLISFLMQYGLVKNMDYGVFTSAFVLGGLYLFTTKLLWKKYSEQLRFFTETFLILGSVFVTLSAAFLLDRPTLAIFYAIEGSGLVFVGLRQKRPWSYLSGSFLILVVSLIYYVVFAAEDYYDTREFGQAVRLGGLFSPLVLTQTVIVLSSFFTSRQFFKNGTGFVTKLLGSIHMVYAAAFWLYWGGTQADFYFAKYELTAFFAFLAVSLIVFETLRTCLPWPEIRALIGAYPWLILILYAGVVGFGERLLGQSWQSLIWVFLFGAQYFHLWRSDQSRWGFYRKLNHFVTTCVLLLVATGIARTCFSQVLPVDAFYLRGFFLYPTIFLLAIAMAMILKRPSWLFERHKAFCAHWIAAPVLAVFWVLLFFMQFSYNGKAPPVTYLPFLNPHDLNVIFFLFTMATYRWFCKREGLQRISIKLDWLLSRALSFTVFVWLNFVLIRTIFNWTDDFKYFEGYMNSKIVQASLTIFWSLSALIIMVFATRRRLRYSWLVGAGLLMIVVFKLFFIDLSQLGNAMRVISFLGSGGLFVLIGYLSPIPPSHENREKFV